MRKFLLIILLIAISHISMAARLAGAYIEYRWNPNATRYDFTLYIYKDCSDNDRLNDFENIRVRRGANGTQIDEFRVDKLPGAPLDVGNICPQQLAQSNCRGGTIPSIEKHVYKGSYRLPAPQRADNWFFYWFNDQQPRSPGVNGAMANASGPNVIYVEAFLNNLDAERNSPVFTTEPNFFGITGQPSTIDNSAFDDAGNRISYRLVPIRNNIGNNYSYIPPFTPNNPINAAFWQLNGRGIINVTPNSTPTTGAYAIVATAIESGIPVTSTTRDIAFFSRDDNNIPPTLQDATGGNIFGGDTIVYCFPYSPQTITITATNPEASQIVSVTGPDDIVRLLPGVIVTSTPGTTGAFTFTWTPDGPATIRLLLTAKDGACPREGVSQRTYVIIVRRRLEVSLPQNSRVACDRDLKFLPATVRFGAPPFTYNWTALSGEIAGPTNTQNTTVRGIGAYTLQVTDRYGCVSSSTNGSDTANVQRAFGRAWATATNQPYACFNRQVPPNCNYEGCVNTPLDFLYLTQFPTDVQGTVVPGSWVWSFGQSDALRPSEVEPNYLVAGTTSGTTSQSTGRASWARKGLYRVKVCFTARVIFEGDTSTCDYCDSVQFQVFRKPDLLPIRLDSCKGETFTFYNDATGRITGRFAPPKPQDTLECRPEFGQIYKMNVWRMNYRTLPDGRRELVDSTRIFTTNPWGNPGLPPDLQPSCDTIRFNNPQSLDIPDSEFGNILNPPSYRFWIRASNQCGDSSAFFETYLFCRPVFWPEFTDVPEPIAPPVTWNVIPRGCPVPVQPTISSACSPGPYTWRFKGALNETDTTSGIGFYDEEGIYEVFVKDSKGCTFKKKFQMVSDVVLKTIRPQANCQSPNCYSFFANVSGNRIGGTAIRTVYDYGDGVRDTVNAADPTFRRRINENKHCYTSTGTFSYKFIVISQANPDYPDGICIDSVSISIYVDEVIPNALILDSTLCYQGLTGSGLPYWETLTIDAPYAPGVADWILYPNLADPRERTEKRFSVTGNGRITYGNYRTPGKYRAVLVTNLQNGCSVYDTFNFELAKPITGGIFTANNCYPTAPVTYSFITDSINAIGRIADMRWDFGDGTIVMGKDKLSVPHQYLEESVQIIRLVVTDTLGCAYPFEFTLNPPPFPPITLNGLYQLNGQVDPICFAETRTFTIPNTALPADGRGDITWEVTGPENFTESGFVDTVLTHTYTRPGNYIAKVTVSRQDGRCSRSAEFNFVVYALPKPALVINRPCEGNPVILDGSGSVPGFATDTIVNYDFSIVSGPSVVPGISGPDSVVSMPIDVVGDYTARLIVTTKNGCSDSIKTNFRVRPRPVASFTFADQSGFPEVRAQAPISFTSTSTDATSRIRVYDWNFGDGTDTTGARIVKTYERANIWQVIHTVTNEENCSASDTQLVDLKAYMLFPTAFTPNGDGLNDRFRLITRGLDRVLEYRIYNRWGEEVFNGGTSSSAAWDGTINGSNSPSGIYIIRASGITIYGEQLTVDGRIVLIR